MNVIETNNKFVRKYIEYHEEYTKKYGQNTVVLKQTGSHFNIFAVINDEVSYGPDIYHICNNIFCRPPLLGLALPRFLSL